MLLEAGTASGREPTATVELRSYLSQFLQERGFSLGAEDEGPFPMRLLHFRRTFVEKMFAIHSKVELLKRDGQPLGTYARHYYDLFQLAAQEEVIAMLAARIRRDQGGLRPNQPRAFLTQLFLSRGNELCPERCAFSATGTRAEISVEYEEQCRLLCYGPYPSWTEIQARLEELRHLL